jgi:TolB-like protein
MTVVPLLLLALGAGPVEGPVAVLPFKNLNAEAKLDWLKLGIAETLIADLKKGGQVPVVERTQIDRALTEVALQNGPDGEDASAARAGKLVGAQTLVLGSYQRAGDTLRINARFVSVETGVVTQAVKATGPMAGVFSLEDQVVDKLLDRPVAQRPKRKPSPKTLRAFELYAMSVATASDAERVGYLRSSLQADPDFVYAKDALAALQERMRGYSQASGDALASQTADALARIEDSRTPVAERAQAAAALVDSLRAARRFNTMVRVAARLAALPGAELAELAADARFEGEMGRHHFDAGLAVGEAFLKQYPASLRFRNVEQAMNKVISARKRSDARQAEFDANVADLRKKLPAQGRTPPEDLDWDYAPCLASRWNSRFGEPMYRGCSEFLARHEKDTGGDAPRDISAAHFFMVLALGERGELDSARSQAEQVRAASHEWDDQLDPLMADWPTDTEKDAAP